MKIKFLWMTVLCAVFLSACSDDDDKKKTLSKAFSYDGEEIAITNVAFDAESLEDGNYDLEFASEDEANYIVVQLSGEWDGEKVDLSEVDDEFDWSWYVHYEQDQGEDWITIIEGFGVDEEEFGDVASGELYIKLVDPDEMIFDVQLSLTTTEDKKFKLNYKGVFTPEGGGGLAKKQ